MKKRITLLLAVLLLALALPSAVWADNIHGSFRYTIKDASVTITAYYGNETEVVVPAMIGTYPVNAVKAGVFKGGPAEKIYLPDSIMTIEEGAFSPGQSVFYYSNGSEPVQAGRQGPAGIFDELRNLVTTDSEGNLVIVSPAGNEAVLDDTQSYSVDTDELGQTVITGENGEAVQLGQDGTVSFTDAQNNRVSVSAAEIISKADSYANKSGSEEVDIDDVIEDGSSAGAENGSSPLTAILLAAAALIIVAAVALAFSKKFRKK